MYKTNRAKKALYCGKSSQLTENIYIKEERKSMRTKCKKRKKITVDGKLKKKIIHFPI